MTLHSLQKNKPKIYSFSRLGTFENCEASYKLGYIDKVENVAKLLEFYLAAYPTP